jgi:hypothetical protein
VGFGGDSRRWGHGHLVFDGRQTAEGGLASASVVGALDPGDDLDAELVAGGPATLGVEDVLLEGRSLRSERAAGAMEMVLVRSNWTFPPTTTTSWRR